MKCGWICTTCKTAHRSKEGLVSKPCVGNGHHSIVESPLMCNKCFMLSDNMKALQSNLCPKALDFDTASERGEVLASPTEEKKEKDGVKGSIQYEMEATKKEIRRLQLLKEMQLERQRLADLIAKKRTKECYLSERFFGGTISQKNKVEHDTT